MTRDQAGTFLGRIPFTRLGAQPDPIVVVAGGQAFVQRPTPARVARDGGRIARIMPPGRSFILVGHDPTPAGYSLTQSRWSLRLGERPGIGDPVSAGRCR